MAKRKKVYPKVTKVIDLEKIESMDGLSKSEKIKVRNEVKNYLKEQILEDVDKGISSVTGRKWAPLKKGPYIKEKRAATSVVRANLELTGDLLDSFDVKTKGKASMRLEAGWTNPRETGKADGHNNHSGKSKLPLRQSIPKKKQNFRKGIIEEIRDIILDAKEGEESL